MSSPSFRSPFPPRLRRHRSQQGIALISVLAVLLLLSLLVVTFLIRAQIARNSSANYRTTTDTRLLADTVINLVQAEINDATTYGSSTSTGQSTGTAPYTWASQPGAIRTFDSTGTLQKIYRLYSSPSLTTTKVSDLLDGSGNTVEIPSNWTNSPGQWVDLNAPVSISGMTDASGNSVAAYSIYPILDPRDPTSASSAFLTSAKMPGFAFDTTKVATSTTNPAPMPVQWLYVLKNGQIAPVTGGDGTTVTFTAPNAPTTDNPIIGRVAFWTDDDTCKVNINTAGGAVSARNDPLNYGTTKILPAPWDVPRFAGSWDDLKMFAECQPVSGEYQRYPGHPATTLLYPILNGLGFSMPEITGLKTATSYPLGYTPGANTQNNGTSPTGVTSALFSLLPRYNDDNGSQAGIANTTGTYTGSSYSATPITSKRDRLYTSLGELLYTPGRTRNNITSANTTGLTRQQIETGKFFLTAHNRAPELTLFGTPRVTIWPVPDKNQKASWQASNQTQTAIDQMIAFCSTTDTGSGGTPAQYYFQRYDSTSATNDWTNESRNQALYGYLQDLTSANIPGFGGNFLAKYSGTQNVALIANERDQILTEILDYIRCTNLNDHGNPTGVNFATRGEVVPLKVTSTASGTRTASTTSGLGRVETLSEIALQVICTADGSNNLATLNAANPNAGYSSTGNSGTSVAYNTPVITPVSATIGVSPVIGSASDPGYVSNLPVAQFLRDTANNIVDIYGTTVTSANSSTCTPFPANQTLTTTGNYGDTLNALPVGSKKLQAALLFEVACPMMGYDIMMRQGGQGPDINIHVTNIQNIPIAGQNPFPNRTDTTTSIGPNVNGNGYLNGFGATVTTPYGWTNNGDPDMGGIAGFRFPLTSYSTTATNTGKSLRCSGWSGKGALTPQAGSTNDTLGTSSSTIWQPFTGSTLPYRFISNPFTVSSSAITVGGSGTFNVALEMPQTTSSPTVHIPYQTFSVAFPSVTLNSPTLPAYGFRYGSSSTQLTHAPDWWGFDNRIGWCSTGSFIDTSSSTATATPNIGLACVIRGDNAPPAGGWASGTAWSYKSTTGTTASPNTVAGLTTGATSYGDVVRSIIPTDGDYRITMAKSAVVADPSATPPDFIKTPQYTTTTVAMTHLLMEPKYTQGTTGVDRNGKLISGANYAEKRSPKVTSVLSSGTPNPQNTWDWDSGGMTSTDGAYSGKADEGNVYSPSPASGNTNIPYINDNNQGTTTSYFTANRIISSAVAFGSLPTGVAEGIPWRTLLFRPQLNRSTYTSPLSATPKDELLLDLFTMPVVQPYAISEPFSTAGKVNMNYQILPFTYITRSTALQAVLGSEMIARMATAQAARPANNATPYYQGGGIVLAQTSTQGGVNTTQTQSPSGPVQARLPLNLSDTNGTLRQFKARFTSGDIFRSPAEICDIYLVPIDYSNGGYTDWTSDAKADAGWYSSDFGLVGDNVREHPYGDLYPRLTTKSNTYTVYYKVQVLKNPTNVDQTQWNDKTGVVTGEYRGSTTLERYLDPNNNSIPDYTDSSKNPAVTPGAPGLDTFYQWRVVANTAFAP